MKTLVVNNTSYTIMPGAVVPQPKMQDVDAIVDALIDLYNADPKGNTEAYCLAVKINKELGTAKGFLKPMDFAKEISYGLSGYSYNRLKEYNIDTDVYLPTLGRNLQRPEVWTLEQKQQLIYSILKGIHIPSLSIIYTRDQNRIEVIDGKQRLLSLMQFCENQFPIHLSGIEYYFNQLNCLNRTLVSSRFEFTCNILYSPMYKNGIECQLTDQEKLQWFERINFLGTPILDHFAKK